uniref:Uncharacterized protein n=1 Tax=Cyprinus carpio TaxID=7962 RepID=A0A8C1SI05_CYPCA
MSSSSGLLAKELKCSVCLDVFTDPVSTPCGHNFCKSCLNRCWENIQNCFCPFCKETFSKRPDLKINTALSEVVQLFQKKFILSKSEVLCDVCDERKLKKQDEELIQELQQEISELKMRDTELDHLLHTEDHLQLLQIDPSLCSPPHTRNWPEISMNTDVSVETLRRALTQLQETLDQKLSQTVLRRMQQYAVDVTLDPDTAHPNLILSNDGKQVRHGDIMHGVPDYPERFDKCASVLGKEGFLSGRFYFEVQLKGKSKWDLGVARESINRKGKIRVSPQNGYWTVGLWNENEYWACADSYVLLSLRVKPQKVGVFVDYEEGLVSFYDVESRSHIYSFTGQSFTNRIYPYFCPFSNDSGKNSAPLIISPVNFNE